MATFNHTLTFMYPVLEQYFTAISQDTLSRKTDPEFIISSYYVMLIICSFSIISLMQHPSIKLMYGVSKHHYYAISNIGQGVLTLVFNLILVRYYGIYGAAMGAAIAAMIFKIFVQPVYTCGIVKVSIYEYCFNTLFLTTLKSLIPLLIYFYFIYCIFFDIFFSIICKIKRNSNHRTF